jgi:DNA repair exonuclease SbcCD nuclease subunit
MGRPRLPVYQNLLRDISALADTWKCSSVVVAGDLLDQKNKPPLEVLLATLSWMRKSSSPIFWLRGNHESPSKEDPEKSVMTLFSSYCEPILESGSHSFGRPVYFLPWYPAERYLEEVEKAKEWARQQSAKPILFTHVGLKEGSTSPSNFHPPSSVSVADLEPSLWGVVIVGDYHAHQFLAPNVFYTGAPIPHNFGDFDIKGVWVLDTEKLTVQPVKLSGFPEFVQWDSTEGSKPSWGKDDYVRIYAAPDKIESLRAEYPDADVRVKVDEKTAVLPTDSRMSLDATASHDVLVSRYLEYKNIEGEQAECLKAVGLEILKSL